MATRKLKKLLILLSVSLGLLLVLPSCANSDKNEFPEETNNPEQSQESSDTGETNTYEPTNTPEESSTSQPDSQSPGSGPPYPLETKTLAEELANAPVADDPKYPFIQYYTIEKTLKLDTGETVQELDFKIPQFKEDTQASRQNNEIIMKIAENEFKTAQMYYNTVIQSEEALKSIRDKSTAFVSGYSMIYEVTFANDRIADILISGYEYTGGAHGMPWRKNLVLNRIEGGKLTLKDLYPDSLDTVLEARNKAFEELIQNSGDNEFFKSALETVQKNTKDDGNYYLTEEGISFYYAPYELGPYSRGYVDVVVPYGSLPPSTYFN